MNKGKDRERSPLPSGLSNEVGHAGGVEGRRREFFGPRGGPEASFAVAPLDPHRGEAQSARRSDVVVLALGRVEDVFLLHAAGASLSRTYSNTLGLGLFTPTSSQVTLSWNGSPMFALMCSSAHASAFVTATSRYRVPSSSSAPTVSGKGGHDRMESLKLSASSSRGPMPHPDAMSR